LLVGFFESVPSMIDAQLKSEIGVNLFEYTVLAMLSEEAGRTLQMTALAAASFGSISRLSHAVSRFEKRGWVTKEAGEGSRRHNVVTLTDEGYEALAAAAPTHISEVRRLIFDPLTADEASSLSTILHKIIGASDPELQDVLADKIPDIIKRNNPA